jgi:hypothetical protein
LTPRARNWNLSRIETGRVDRWVERTVAAIPQEVVMGREKVRHVVIDFLHSRQIDENADYCRRGCRFARLSDADLMARWFTVFRAMADAPLDPSCLAETIDVEAELDLRNIAPPYDQVQPELDRWLAATDVVLQAIKRDPEMASDLMDWMIMELQAFEEARIRSN